MTLPFATGSVTLYNRRESADAAGRRSVRWVRRVLTGCSWTRALERTQNDMSTGFAESVICRIPASDAYLPPDQWDALANPAGKFTLAAGDIIVLGTVADEISEALSAAELLGRYARLGAITVRSAKDNARTGILPHYMARGV